MNNLTITTSYLTFEEKCTPLTHNTYNFDRNPTNEQISQNTLQPTNKHEFQFLRNYHSLLDLLSLQSPATHSYCAVVYMQFTSRWGIWIYLNCTICSRMCLYMYLVYGYDLTIHWLGSQRSIAAQFHLLAQNRAHDYDNATKAAQRSFSKPKWNPRNQPRLEKVAGGIQIFCFYTHLNGLH